MAVVLRSHASNGVIEVFGAGRENDSPNTINVPGDISGGSMHVGPTAIHLDDNWIVVSGSYHTDDNWLVVSGSYHTDDNWLVVSGSYGVGDNWLEVSGSYYTANSDMSGSTISGSSFRTIEDHTVSGSARMVGMITHTSATPPTASGYAQGTIYVQYTA